MKPIAAAVFLTLLLGLSSGSEDVDATYSCDFEEDECGFVNLPHSSGRFERKYAEINGRKGHMMIIESQGGESVSAMIQSPFFQIDRSLSMCLSVDIYMGGESTEGKIIVEAGDSEYRSGIVRKNKELPWTTKNIDLHVLNSAKIIFQGKATNGKVAFDNFTLKTGSCPK